MQISDNKILKYFSKKNLYFVKLFVILLFLLFFYDNNN
jgi:hypothetical protein